MAFLSFIDSVKSNLEFLGFTIKMICDKGHYHIYKEWFSLLILFLHLGLFFLGGELVATDIIHRGLDKL